MMNTTYQYVTERAILEAMGIRVEVSAGEPGNVIIDVYGVPAEVSREAIINRVDNNQVRPLTDRVVFNFKK